MLLDNEEVLFMHLYRLYRGHWGILLICMLGVSCACDKSRWWNLTPSEQACSPLQNASISSLWNKRVVRKKKPADGCLLLYWNGLSGGEVFRVHVYGDGRVRPRPATGPDGSQIPTEIRMPVEQRLENSVLRSRLYVFEEGVSDAEQEQICKKSMRFVRYACFTDAACWFYFSLQPKNNTVRVSSDSTCTLVTRKEAHSSESVSTEYRDGGSTKEQKNTSEQGKIPEQDRSDKANLDTDPIDKTPRPDGTPAFSSLHCNSLSTSVGGGNQGVERVQTSSFQSEGVFRYAALLLRDFKTSARSLRAHRIGFTTSTMRFSQQIEGASPIVFATRPSSPSVWMLKGKKTLESYSVVSGRRESSVQIHSIWTSLLFDLSGNLLLGGRDRNHLELWSNFARSPTQKNLSEKITLSEGDTLAQITWSGTGSHFATLTQKGEVVSIWNRSGSLVKVIRLTRQAKERALSLVLHPTLPILYVGMTQAKILVIKEIYSSTEGEQRSYTVPKVGQSDVSSLAIAPDGTFLVVGSSEGDVTVMDSTVLSHKIYIQYKQGSLRASVSPKTVHVAFFPAEKGQDYSFLSVSRASPMLMQRHCKRSD